MEQKLPPINDINSKGSLKVFWIVGLMLVGLAIFYQLNVKDLSGVGMRKSNSIEKEKLKEDENIRDFAKLDQQPEYPGGPQEFKRFFRTNFKLPQLALEQGAKGHVIVQFVVEKDGSLSDIKVVKDPGMGTKEEAIRVLKMMPHWKPGVQDGKNVRVAYTLPIRLSTDTR